MLRNLVLSYLALIWVVSGDSFYVAESCDDEETFKETLTGDCTLDMKMGFKTDEECHHYRIKCSFQSYIEYIKKKASTRSFGERIKLHLDKITSNLVSKVPIINNESAKDEKDSKHVNVHEDQIPDNIRAKETPFPLSLMGRVYEYVFQMKIKEKVDRIKKSIKYDSFLYNDQFYLLSDGTYSEIGFDMGVLEVQDAGYKGKDIKIYVLDAGCDLKSAGIKDRIDQNMVENYSEEKMEESHGTGVAGLIASEGKKGDCITGLAPEATLGIAKILGYGVRYSDIAEALSKNCEDIDIYNNSWGPSDDGENHSFPPTIIETSIKHGIKKGRHGKGSIYTWANGNGGHKVESCGADGFSGSKYALNVQAVNENGLYPDYAEDCGHVGISAYVGDDHSPTIYSSGYCTIQFRGTSAGCPMISGCVALTLEANPNLTWRDLHHVVYRSASLPQGYEEVWQINGAGLYTSNFFGFGVMDCTRSVRLAKNWKPIGTLCSTTKEVRTQELPDDWREYGWFKVVDSRGKSSVIREAKKYNGTMDIKTGENTMTFKLNKSGQYLFAEQQGDESLNGKTCSSEIIESVMLELYLVHVCRGSLEVSLKSPSGTVSSLLTKRQYDVIGGTITFKLKSNQFMGEKVDGDWTLKIIDHGKCPGTFVDTTTPEFRGRLVGFKVEQFSTNVEGSVFERNKELLSKLLLSRGKEALKTGKAKTLTAEEIYHSSLESKWKSLYEIADKE